MHFVFLRTRKACLNCFSPFGTDGWLWSCLLTFGDLLFFDYFIKLKGQYSISKGLIYSSNSIISYYWQENVTFS